MPGPSPGMTGWAMPPPMDRSFRDPALVSPVRPRIFPLSTETTVAVGLTLLVSLLVLVPIVTVVLGAAREAGGFSARPLLIVLGSTTIIANTLLVGIGATLLAVAIGAALALILARIDTPGRTLLSRLVTLPLYITPLLTAIAWSWLGSPRGGLVNLVCRELFGVDSLINLLSPGGVVFVSGLSYVPLPFLLIGAALRGMDPSLEESARVHGASALASLRRPRAYNFVREGSIASSPGLGAWRRKGPPSGGPPFPARALFGFRRTPSNGPCARAASAHAERGEAEPHQPSRRLRNAREGRTANDFARIVASRRIERREVVDNCLAVEVVVVVAGREQKACGVDPDARGEHDIVVGPQAVVVCAGLVRVRHEVRDRAPFGPLTVPLIPVTS